MIKRLLATVALLTIILQSTFSQNTNKNSQNTEAQKYVSEGNYTSALNILSKFYIEDDINYNLI